MIIREQAHVGSIGQAITHLPPIGPVVEVYSPETERYIRDVWWYKHPYFVRRYAGEPSVLGATYGSAEEPLMVPGYIAGEYAFIRKKIGPYERISQSLLRLGNRSVDRIVVKDDAGSRHVFYFDVSGPLDEMVKKLKAAWEEMKRADPSLRRFN